MSYFVLSTVQEYQKAKKFDISKSFGFFYQSANQLIYLSLHHSSSSLTFQVV